MYGEPGRDGVATMPGIFNCYKYCFFLCTNSFILLGPKGIPGDAGEAGFPGLPGTIGDAGMFNLNI